jgi:hypothetical protein
MRLQHDQRDFILQPVDTLNKVPLNMTRYHVPDTKEGRVLALRAERNLQREPLMSCTRLLCIFVLSALQESRSLPSLSHLLRPNLPSLHEQPLWVKLNEYQ